MFKRRIWFPSTESYKIFSCHRFLLVPRIKNQLRRGRAKTLISSNTLTGILKLLMIAMAKCFYWNLGFTGNCDHQMLLSKSWHYRQKRWPKASIFVLDLPSIVMINDSIFVLNLLKIAIINHTYWSLKITCGCNDRTHLLKSWIFWQMRWSNVFTGFDDKRDDQTSLLDLLAKAMTKNMDESSEVKKSKRVWKRMKWVSLWWK